MDVCVDEGVAEDSGDDSTSSCFIVAAVIEA